MDYDKMLQLLNKKNQNFFFLSNKPNEPSKGKPENNAKLEKRPYLHFDFGNSIEDKRKALRQKIKNKGININVTKFAIPKKIDLAQQLLTKNLKGKEKMQPLVMTKKPLIDLFPKYVVDWRTRWALNPRAENE